jgi:hypothetical protein
MWAFAYLTATVLVVIAIGVGVSASWWTEPAGPPVPSGVLHEYGPPGYRFAATFPGKARCWQGPWSLHYCESAKGVETPFATYVFLVEVSNLVAIPKKYRPSSPLSGASGRQVRFGRAHGVVGPTECQEVGQAPHLQQNCAIDMIVTDGATVWDVVTSETFVKVNTHPMTRFLESFRPIEG